MSNFDERLKRGASSSALAGTTGATLGAAAVVAVCAVGGSLVLLALSSVPLSAPKPGLLLVAFLVVFPVFLVGFSRINPRKASQLKHKS